MLIDAVPGSFRDPSGFVFCQDKRIYRAVNEVYRKNYEHFINSGLYENLTGTGLLIPHSEVDVPCGLRNAEEVYKVIKPEPVPFISYPYEWCFSQLKDAALTTLKIQRIALDFEMSLKDCSAYNIQFIRGKPVFIDTLSFEKYPKGQPWAAYRQFCQHFLAPLALMNYTDIRLNQLFRVFIDGVPLDLASSLLSFRTRVMFSLLSHIHLHAKSQEYFANKAVNARFPKMGRLSLAGLIDNLESSVKKLKWQPPSAGWADYYENTNYSLAALHDKKQLVAEFVDKVRPEVVWDLGANTGLFSRLAGKNGIKTISFDIDPGSVEKNYLECVNNGETGILPLLLDLTNPSPGIGWMNEERMSFLERGPADLVLALALIHHLAISNNLPLSKIADFLSKICSSAIIEFVPKGDSQVQRLLKTREDIFPGYTRQAFEREFSKLFSIQNSKRIMDSERILYLMTRR